LARHKLVDSAEEALSDFAVVFPIQAHDLLMAGTSNNPRLLRGLKMGLRKDSRCRSTGSAKTTEQSLSRLILSYDAAGCDAASERSYVMDHIRRTTGSETLGYDPKHRHWRFRRDPLDVPPDKTIQHEVANDQETAPTEFVQKSEQTIRARNQLE